MLNISVLYLYTCIHKTYQMIGGYHIMNTISTLYSGEEKHNRKVKQDLCQY